MHMMNDILQKLRELVAAGCSEEDAIVEIYKAGTGLKLIGMAYAVFKDLDNFEALLHVRNLTNSVDCSNKRQNISLLKKDIVDIFGSNENGEQD